jgi:sialidase-1
MTLFRLAFFHFLLLSPFAGLHAGDPLLEKSEVFPPEHNGINRYRIPGIVVTTKGTVLAYCEARKNDSKDWGEIQVHLRCSTDGGRTWMDSQHIAHKAERTNGQQSGCHRGPQDRSHRVTLLRELRPLLFHAEHRRRNYLERTAGNHSKL